MLQEDALRMVRVLGLFRHRMPLTCTRRRFLSDASYHLLLCLRPAPGLAAENLFLRKQLALSHERNVKPSRATTATRITLVGLARWFDWRQALAVVQPETFLRWPRQGCRLFWRWPSRPGHPPLPIGPQALIRRMAHENPTWGQARMANALLLMLGLEVAPRPVRKSMPKRMDQHRGTRATSPHWHAFVRKHAQAIIAGDFGVVVTATLRWLSVFVVMDHATRRILHCTVTVHPTASWTLQQLREAIPADHGYRCRLHDRDSIVSPQLDQHIPPRGLRGLTTPPQSPQANTRCERRMGTLRQACVDFLIPLSACHLRRLLKARVSPYHARRPHMALGPGIPQPLASLPVPLQADRHRLPQHLSVMSHPILSGLHPPYELAETVA